MNVEVISSGSFVEDNWNHNVYIVRVDKELLCLNAKSEPQFEKVIRKQLGVGGHLFLANPFANIFTVVDVDRALDYKQ